MSFPGWDDRVASLQPVSEPVKRVLVAAIFQGRAECQPSGCLACTRRGFPV